VRADKLDERGFEQIGKVNNEAILIPTYVEDGSIISDEVHVISKRSLQVCRFTPVTLGNDLIPSTEWYLGLRVSLPKGMECPPCYYVHSHSMFPIWDQFKNSQDGNGTNSEQPAIFADI
jgi:hypothetical protein